MTWDGEKASFMEYYVWVRDLLNTFLRVWVCVCTLECVLTEARGIGSPASGITVTCETPDLGAEN